MPRLVFDVLRSQPRCPHCGAKFSQASLRIFANTADCDSCHGATDLSTLASDLENAPLTARPPRGVSLSETATGWALRARSVSRINIVASWLGFGGWIFTAKYLLFPVVGDVVPIAILALIPAFGVALYTWGKCEVRVEWPQGEVFTGIGRLGWKYRFNAAGLQTVTLKQGVGDNERNVRFIELLGSERVVFGQQLDDAQRSYIAAFLVEKLNAAEFTRRVPSLACHSL